MNETSRNMKQDITYWAPLADDEWGERSYGSPTTVKGRWEENNQVVANAQGEEVSSRAMVYMPIDVKEEGYLFLGTSASSDPTTVDGAQRVKAFLKTPNLRHLHFERRAFL